MGGCVWSALNRANLWPLYPLTPYRVREFMAFTSDVLVERTRAGQRQSVKEQGVFINWIMSHCALVVDSEVLSETSANHVILHCWLVVLVCFHITCTYCMCVHTTHTHTHTHAHTHMHTHTHTHTHTHSHMWHTHTLVSSRELMIIHVHDDNPKSASS